MILPIVVFIEYRLYYFKSPVFVYCFVIINLKIIFCSFVVLYLLIIYYLINITLLFNTKLTMEQKKRKSLIHSYFQKKQKNNDSEQLQNEVSLKLINFFHFYILK